MKDGRCVLRAASYQTSYIILLISGVWRLRTGLKGALFGVDGGGCEMYDGREIRDDV